MGSDVNTVRETSSARAMGVAIASGDDRRVFFGLPVRWPSGMHGRGRRAKMVPVGVMRAVDVPKRAREVYFYVRDACASRRRGE